MRSSPPWTATPCWTTAPCRGWERSWGRSARGPGPCRPRWGGRARGVTDGHVPWPRPSEGQCVLFREHGAPGCLLGRGLGAAGAPALLPRARSTGPGASGRPAGWTAGEQVSARPALGLSSAPSRVVHANVAPCSLGAWFLRRSARPSGHSPPRGSVFSLRGVPSVSAHGQVRGPRRPGVRHARAQRGFCRVSCVFSEPGRRRGAPPGCDSRRLPPSAGPRAEHGTRGLLRRVPAAHSPRGSPLGGPNLREEIWG